VITREREGLKEAVALKLGLCEGEAEMDIEEDVVAEHEGWYVRPSIGQEEGQSQSTGTIVPGGQ